MGASYTNQFLNLGLEAIYPHHSKWINVNLDVSTVFARGTVLGEIQITDTYSLSTGVQGSGTFTLTFGGQTTATIARNAAASAVQTALRALSTVGSGGASVALASGTPGTDAVYTITFTGTLGYTPNAALTATFTSLATPSNASLTKSTTGQHLGTYKAYASGNTDGSQVPCGLLQYDCATDSSGNITMGSVAGGGPFGQVVPAVPMFIAGDFYTSDLTGLDANAVTKMGRLLEGTLTSGVFRMP